MPKKIHRQLMKSAKKKGLAGTRFDQYVYGALAGLKKKRKPGRKRTKRSLAKPRR